jgi:hypothetical protein
MGCTLRVASSPLGWMYWSSGLRTGDGEAIGRAQSGRQPGASGRDLTSSAASIGGMPVWRRVLAVLSVLAREHRMHDRPAQRPEDKRNSPRGPVASSAPVRPFRAGSTTVCGESAAALNRDGSPLPPRTAPHPDCSASATHRHLAAGHARPNARGRQSRSGERRNHGTCQHCWYRRRVFVQAQAGQSAARGRRDPGRVLGSGQVTSRSWSRSITDSGA